jgi:glucokinase
VLILAADIGGTNTRLALIEMTGGAARMVERESAPSRAVSSLGERVRQFLAGKPVPARACFAVAGPVVDGTVHTTNLPWTIRTAELAGEIGIPDTVLINDFAAVGESLALLGPAELATLQAGQRDPTGPVALIGAGTGLGQGFLFHDGTRYRVRASEGGHASFAARTAREWALYTWLEQRLGPVSWESVLSGRGLTAGYQYLSGSDTPEEPAAISARGLGGSDPAAVEALDLFAAAYGAHAGNLALTVLATGGVYVAGGIAPRLIAKLSDGTFMKSFREKGELEEFLARVPVQVIMSPDAGLLGAAALAARGPDR